MGLGVATTQAGAATTATTLDLGNSTSTAVNAINASGELAGLYVDASTNVHGFTKVPGSPATTIDLGNSTYTQVNAINASGEVAGLYLDASFKWLL